MDYLRRVRAAETSERELADFMNFRLYPSRYRSNAMALSTASNWGWNFLLAFFTPFIVGDIDFRYGYIFAACLFVSAAVVYLFVIEGQGRTLEEIDTMYILHVNPRESTKWIAPPPEELITTERLVRGEFAATGTDLEHGDSSRARAKETEPGKQLLSNLQI
jgi:MFS transporter, SP family, sugar:H+ symporter